VEALLDERDLIIRTQQVQLAERSITSSGGGGSNKHSGSKDEAGTSSKAAKGSSSHHNIPGNTGVAVDDAEAVVHLREMVQIKTEVRLPLTFPFMRTIPGLQPHTHTHTHTHTHPHPPTHTHTHTHTYLGKRCSRKGTASITAAS
jgi:hypothetical protein